MALNWFENFLISVCAVSECVSISAFASLLGFPVGITSSALCLQISAFAGGIKKYKSII